MVFCWMAAKSIASQMLMLALIKGGTKLSSKFRKIRAMEKRSGSCIAHWICAVFDSTVCDLTGWKQLERQELLFAWWLISDQRMKSRWGKRVKAFIFSSTLKYSTPIQLFFCSFLFLFSTLMVFKSSFKKISPVLLTLPELPLPSQPFLSCL